LTGSLAGGESAFLGGDGEEEDFFIFPPLAFDFPLTGWAYSSD